MSLALFAEMQAIKARIAELERKVAEMSNVPRETVRPTLTLPKKEVAHG